jgi:hypothetical protein
MSDTDIGERLNQARIELVNKYTDGLVLDIGIGSGAFLQRLNTYGFDINPKAIEYLIQNKLYRHPFKGGHGITFWDSLEHIHDPTMIIQGAKEYIFVSMPIYDDSNHILRSKHFRKDEHCWYFTMNGLIMFMQYYGFQCIEINNMETEIGREDIKTFVFKRLP